MKNYVGMIYNALDGRTMCVASICELWVKPTNGNSFAVHSIVDETDSNLPWYSIYVTDYKGNRYHFVSLSKDSQAKLCTFVNSLSRAS